MTNHSVSNAKKPSDYLSEGFNIFETGQVSLAGYEGQLSNQFKDDLSKIHVFIREIFLIRL
jgi:hypothetical protein